MSRGLRAQILIALATLLVFSGTAEAQAYGRVSVVVQNQQGEPLQGVKVVVTCKELEKYREVATTNKKGKVTVSFTDATKAYDFRFEYEDHQPAEMTIKPKIRQSITREVTLTEGQVVTTDKGGVESHVIYTPAERVYNEGVEALKSNDLATAKGKFLEALEKNEQMAPAHAALAGIHLQEKNYEAALASVTRYLELEPDNPNGLFMLYDVHTALGNQKEADAALKVLKETDKSGDAVALVYNAGVSAVKVGNYATAKARFLEAIEMDATLKEAAGALAVIYLTEKDHQKAAEWAEKHLALDPGNERSLRIRWEAYRELGDAEKTKEAFKALAEKNPQVLAAEFYDQGNDLFEAGDTQAAIEKFEHVLEIDPEHARAHYRLGVCQVGVGDPAGAKEHLQKFVELAPDDPEVATAKDMLKYLN